MKVLITGATGFLGKYIIKEFAKYNTEIIAMGRNIDLGERLEHCQFIQGDFTHYKDILSATKGIDVVIHAGALSTVWGAWDDFRLNNIVGTENVAKACLENKVKRLVFVSSPSIYTSKESKFNIPETHVIRNNHLNHYIESKLEAEKIITSYNKNGLYTVTVRPRGLFGIGDTSIIPRLIKANNKNGIPLINHGINRVDITYVPNVAYAIYLSATKENINGEIFNITNGQPMKFKEILEKLFYQLDIKPRYRPLKFNIAYSLSRALESTYNILNLSGEPQLTKYIVCTLGTSQTLNIDKAKQKLGYTPKFSIEEGISIYAKWYKEHHK
ncbi:NAD-dependent epimerase/dehydratase family protein [Lactococcus lactis subsp. lactis]|uniref:NAD-dependent epimerase/dehydratase family protein n=1 Tax=Lactococcus lactis TaxID=1358 RepID=UPI0021AE55E4|nr:NAD-dependent epimerase/dehydratase family protein [Lactococcus lactis]MCT0017729.1 NAD-dependent epimerase/dehydratase family protein [Lactococcus lactis subsp. lactis]